MKFIAQLLLLAPTATLAVNVMVADAGNLRSRASSQKIESSTAAIKAGVTPQDIQRCVFAASKFVHGPKDIKHTKELSADFCTESGDRNLEEGGNICPHYNNAVSRALDGQDEARNVTAEEWCAITEQRMLEARGATRVPQVGDGPLMNFTIKSTCAPMVDKAMAPATSVDQDTAAGVWYVACMNQHCGHHLPSRTKWCTENHPPTHSRWICESSRDYIAGYTDPSEPDEKTVWADKNLTSQDICKMYGEYVKDLSGDVEAYEHVMHGDTSKRVPAPSTTAHLAIGNWSRGKSDSIISSALHPFAAVVGLAAAVGLA